MQALRTVSQFHGYTTLQGTLNTGKEVIRNTLAAPEFKNIIAGDKQRLRIL